MSEPAEFWITDPLPSGTLLLEASAGTGKTWAIAALVARFVAEGAATLDELLVVTFGRAASAELRDRVRERLVEAETALTSLAAPSGTDDALLDVLRDAPADELERRRHRLRAAVARFDEATITTTHGFCHAVLRGLGTTGDVEPGSALVQDDLDVVDEVVADLYLRAAGRQMTPPFGPDEARVLGRRAVEDPAARLLPVDAEPGSGPDVRRRFAEAVRRESSRRRLAARTLSYDDLLQRLAEALEPADSPARTVMRDRWRIVLVDEFQDTDPVQWQILERAFVGHSTLVLVGDPKQAIYGFRGGDVATYLRAASVADERRTLTSNHRSDPPLVAAVDAVLRGAALGDPQIVVRPAHAAAGPDGSSRLGDPRGHPPFRLRVLTRTDAGVRPGSTVKVADARRRIAADIAADVSELLARGATYRSGTDHTERAVRPGDVAILVERHAEADLVHDALTTAGIAAVRAGGTDVLLSEAGEAWRTLLEAVSAPQRSGLVRAAALGPFLGHDAARLATDDHALTDAVAARLRDLVDLHRERGFAGLAEALVADADVARRILGHVGGRRLLTDLEHVGQVLQQAARDRGLGLAGVLEWLTERRADGALAGDRTRRLDSDADAVQIVTTFVSKGLQYPVVYVPFLFDRYVPAPAHLRLHDDAGGRCLDVGEGGPSWEDHRRRAATERAGEALRLLYVAMTRAQSRLVMHWAPTWNGPHGALTRMLFRPEPTGAAVPDEQPVPSDADAVAVLRAWQERGGPVVERMEPREATPFVSPPASTELHLRTLDRPVDTAWTRTSYSSLVRRDDVARVGSEPVSSGPDDEVDVVADDAGDTLGPSPWSEVVAGAELGTLVHGVLEEVDSTAVDLRREVRSRIAEQLVRRPVAVDPDVLTALLVDVLHSPLGPLAADLTLGDALALRPLRELDFELPLGGGARSPSLRTSTVGRLAEVADLMERHLPTDDPLRPFAPQLRDPVVGSRALRGYLNGSIDLLLRRPDQRSLVVDHKTNRLESVGGGLDAYAPDQLAVAMLHTTYPLQALLYTVAQHRFLRWRQRGYDPPEHLGGVLYLFVRGMTGAEVPRDASGAPYGVFAWQPPVALVLALSDLLDGRTRTEVGA